MSSNNNYNGYGVIWTKARETKLSWVRTQERVNYSPPRCYTAKMDKRTEKELRTFLKNNEEILRCGEPLPPLPDALHSFLEHHLGSYTSDEVRCFLKFKLGEKDKLRKAAELARLAKERGNRKRENKPTRKAANKTLHCKKCRADLCFVELPPGHKHKWRAECTRCNGKNGEPTHDRWASDKFVQTLLRDEPHRVQRRSQK